VVVRAGVVRLVIGAVIVGAIVALGAVWYVRGPGPTAFTGGKSVALFIQPPSSGQKRSRASPG
jgi:hypothetical protein